METPPAGVPLRFEHEGKVWRVAADPVRWYERTNWWEDGKRHPRDDAPAIDLEVWRVQVKPGKRGGELVTVDLIRAQDRTTWFLRPYDSPDD